MFNDEFKMLGFIGILLTLLFSWTWHAVSRIEEHEWTQNEQSQYSRGVDRQIGDLHKEIDRLRTIVFTLKGCNNKEEPTGFDFIHIVREDHDGGDR